MGQHTSLEYALEEYYQTHELDMNSTEVTIKWHKDCHKYFLKKTGVRSFDDITKPVVKNFVRQEIIDGKKPSTVRTRLRSVKAFYRFCIDEGFIDEPSKAKDSPFYKLRLPKVEKTPKFLDMEVIIAVEKSLQKFREYPTRLDQLRWQSMFRMYLYMGIRRTEGRKILKDNVDLERGVILLEKTKKRNAREVVIHPDVFHYLYRYMTYVKSIGIESKYLYFGKYLNKTIHNKTIQKWKLKIEEFAKKKYKIKGFTFHQFRHTLANELLRSGASFRDVMDILGQESVTTYAGYTGTNAQMKKETLMRYDPTNRNQKNPNLNNVEPLLRKIQQYLSQGNDASFSSAF